MNRRGRLDVFTEHYEVVLWMLVAIAGGMIAFPADYLLRSNVLIGCCLMVLLLSMKENQRHNYVYLALMVFFGVVAYVYKVRLFYFFTLFFYVFFLWEALVGRINVLVLFLLVFMSPVFDSLTTIMGFPVRLQLSSWAGHLLQQGGFDVQVEGNVMVMNNNSFSVDDACMGLNMLALSLLMGVFVVGYHYYASRKKLSLMWLLLFFAMVMGMNVVCNLLRILMLVVFELAPENPMHEMVGIICLVLYVVIPLYVISQWMIQRWGKPMMMVERKVMPTPYGKVVFTGMAVVMLGIGVYLHEQRQRPSDIAHAEVNLPNFQVVRMGEGITKMMNEKMLVYVKSIPEFFTSEHTPLLCWKGSGYQFQQIRKIMIEGKEIYAGKLTKKDGEMLYTSWWYSNGTVTTIDQLDWRLRMLKGEEQFCLINITAKDEASLREYVKEVLSKKLLNVNGKADEHSL